MDFPIYLQWWYSCVISPPGVYILIGAGSLVMLVGFFGCCGAVRESQCLLGSVSVHKQSFFSIFLYYIFIICVILCSISAVFCMSADHFWRWGGSWGVWILEQREGTFITSSLQHWFSVWWTSVTSWYPTSSQIIEDVQNFYTSTYDKNNNSTLIMSYQKIVSSFIATVLNLGEKKE